MPLPALIEIIPLTAPRRAQITIPGSKSITNRALILAALANGQTVLRGALWSEDTQVMVECLEKLGFKINVAPDPAEMCNRTITVNGLGGKIPHGGTPAQPLELFVGNAGTAARFLTAFVCLGEGVYRLHGVPRMHERPQAALFSALRELGWRVESENKNDKLPARVFARDTKSLQPLNCTVSIEQSSQFASALLLCANTANWNIKIVGENADESPYVAMTHKLIEAFPRQGGDFQIEPDASSGSYFLAMDWLQWVLGSAPEMDWITVNNWPQTTWQIDSEYLKLRNLKLNGFLSRRTQLGDSIMTAIVTAPFNPHPVKFTDLGRLRLQETERVAALRIELAKCGAKVVESGDTLEVFPSQLHGAEIETYNDHRMAMCFAILGLKVPGIKIKNPACVKKTFPNFFQKLSDAPPAGLGAAILDAKASKPLGHADLFAD